MSVRGAAAECSSSTEARVRGYLAANCAQCHLPDGPVPGNLDFRFATPTDRMSAIDRDIVIEEVLRGISEAIREDVVLVSLCRKLLAHVSSLPTG